MRKKLHIIVIVLIMAISFTSCKTTNEKSLIFEDSMLIDNAPINQMNYSEVIEHFGEPKEIKIERFQYPATVEYNILYILCYDNLEIFFDIGSADNLQPNEKSEVFSFDIVGNKYNIGELKVGMNINEYFKIFGDSKMYYLNDIIEFGSSELISYSPEDEYIYSALKRVMIIPRPENYYSDYEYVYYEQGIAEGTYPIGLAILVKDEIIDRIVYGYPNAS